MNNVAPLPPRDHNSPPVTLPKDEEMLADLQTRYPEIDMRLAEWDGAFKEYPDHIPLDQEDVAKNLQDLLGQVKKESKVWTDSFQKQEKKPLNSLLKIVGNFFTGRFEKAESYLSKWGPVHQDYLNRKADKARQEAEEEAERQRVAAEASRLAAERAEAERKAAAEEAERQRRAAEEARLAAEKAEQERLEADRRRREAEEEERRLADEKKQRDRAEKERNVAAIKEIKTHMREAERLDALAQAEEASDDEIAKLDSLVRPAGPISALAGPLAASMLLDDDQSAFVNDLKDKLTRMRTAMADRAGARERKRLAKEAEEQRKKDEAAAARRKAEAEAEEKRLADARAKREAEEAETARLRQERQTQQAAAKGADEAARGADKDAKVAGRSARDLGRDADRSANRADRIESKLEGSTPADLSRTRGDLGTVGGLVRRWTHAIVDEDLLRAGLRGAMKDDANSSRYAVLVDQLTGDALNGAVYRWMRLHQGQWEGKERIDDALAGVVFAFEEESRIV